MSSDRKRIFTGKVISLDTETVVLPNQVTATFELINHPGGAAVVAVNSCNEICLLKQYRHILKDWIWEIPAGKLDDDEAPELTAKRELHEEAGAKAGVWKSLGDYISSPGVFSEIVHLYLATELEIEKPQPHEDEIYEIHWVSIQQAKKMASDNTIRDGKSVVAILRACEVLNQ